MVKENVNPLVFSCGQLGRMEGQITLFRVWTPMWPDSLCIIEKAKAPVMAGRMCCCAAMADAPFHRRACALRRSPLSFAVQQSAVGAEDIEFVQLMNEKDS